MERRSRLFIEFDCRSIIIEGCEHTEERISKILSAHGVCSRRASEELLRAGRVSVNGVVAKPSREVKVGDVITVSFGSRSLKAEILSVQETVRKDDAAAMYREIGEHIDI